MKLSPIIVRLRANAAYFGGRVFGASELEVVRANVDGVTLPAAFVVPLRDAAETTEGQLGVGARVDERFSVIAALSNTSDDDGLASADAVEDAKSSLRAALENWSPAVGNAPIQYAGGEIGLVDRSVLYFGFDFSSVATGGGAGGTGGGIVSYVLATDLALHPGTTLAAVLSALATNIAATLGGTRMDSDLGSGLESIGAGETRFQLVAVCPGIDTQADANTARTKLQLRLQVHHHLGNAETERDYTQTAGAGKMLTALPVLMAPGYWQVLPGVAVLTDPNLSLPGDVTRT